MPASPESAVVAALAVPTGGSTLVTLAPEVVPAGFIAGLVPVGICVSAGHTDATAEQVGRTRSTRGSPAPPTCGTPCDPRRRADPGRRWGRC